MSQTYHFVELCGGAEVGRVWAGVWTGGALETLGPRGLNGRLGEGGSPWGGGDKEWRSEFQRLFFLSHLSLPKCERVLRYTVREATL